MIARWTRKGAGGISISNRERREAEVLGATEVVEEGDEGGAGLGWSDHTLCCVIYFIQMASVSYNIELDDNVLVRAKRRTRWQIATFFPLYNAC